MATRKVAKGKNDSLRALGRINSDLPPQSPEPEKATAEPPVVAPAARVYTDWEPTDEPSYTEAGKEAYHSKAKYILAHSEKGGGKTYAFLDKMVKHCFSYNNAMGLICVRTRSQANKGGAWEKLQLHILPKWRKKKGIEHTNVMLDSQKNELIWIRTIHGGWSMFVLISANYGTQLVNTAPGYEPSMAFVDELTNCDSEVYYSAIAAQVGRRPGIPGEAQQYLAACNPKGPSNWVYKKWFVEPINEDTGEVDPEFHSIRFSVDDNEKNLPNGYRDHLKRVYKNSPIEAKRLIDGEWIDRPSADSLFGDIFSPEIHVRPITSDGKPHQTLRLLPSRDSSILIGIDSGSTYHAFPFMQWLPVDGRMRWVVFDEVVILKKKTSYPRLIPMVMRRLKWWLDMDEKKPGFIAISDDSAFNQYKPGTGSYDVTEIQKSWSDYDRLQKSNTGEEYLGPIKIRGCPKFDGSVAARVRILQEALGNEEILVSASCKHTQAMMLLLESKKQPKDKPYNDDLSMSPERSDHLHIFDAITYVMLMGKLHPARLIPPSQSSTGSSIITVR
jgi:hypothetical protein